MKQRTKTVGKCVYHKIGHYMLLFHNKEPLSFGVDRKSPDCQMNNDWVTKR